MTERISFVRADYEALITAFDRLHAGMEVLPADIAKDTTPTPPVAAGRPAIAWGQKVSQVFRDRVWWISDTLTAAQGGLFDANNLMACIAWETGEKFTADVKNMAGSGATGLIQFMPATARDLGTTTAKLATMTAEDQLNFVYKYFVGVIKSRGPVLTLEDMYMGILLPSAVGKPNSHVLFTGTGASYRQNAGLDTNKDGKVTKYEAAAKVREKLTKGLQLAA